MVKYKWEIECCTNLNEKFKFHFLTTQLYAVISVPFGSTTFFASHNLQ